MIESVEQSLPLTLGDGHTVQVEHQKLTWSSAMVWHVICSCGMTEYVHGTDYKEKPPREFVRWDLVEKFVNRHRRIVNGERGIYGCGCTPADNYLSKRTRRCPSHNELYIPKTETRKRKQIMPAKEVLKCLAFEYVPPEWAFFTELRVGTGWRSYDPSTGQFDTKWEQRIDAWAINTWQSKQLRRIAFEVKVSRSDFKNEIANPEKRAAAMQLSHQFYFVTPMGLVSPNEIPDDCGLIEIKPTGGRKFTVKAPLHDNNEDAPWRFVASLARRVEREQPSLQDVLADDPA